MELLTTFTPGAPADENMRIDAELMASDRPALRVYTWNPPAVSLGISQDESVLDLDACRRHGIAIARRFTGGAAVMHKDEVTYSFFLPRDVADQLFPTEPGEEAKRTGLARRVRARFREVFLGMFEAFGIDAEAKAEGKWQMPESAVCFHAPAENEILVGGRKIVGSAQSVKRSGVFQHGSIVFAPQEKLLCELIPGAVDRDAVAGIWDFCPDVDAGRVYEELAKRTREVFGFE